jgi:transcriptional regulator with XRE-family HTH domain
MHLRELFATNVRLIRHEGKLSHKQLAHDTQIDRIYVSRVERAVTYVGLKIIGKLPNTYGRAGRILPAALQIRIPQKAD